MAFKLLFVVFSFISSHLSSAFKHHCSFHFSPLFKPHSGIKHYLTYQNGSFFLDDQIIINKNAKLQILVFKCLLSHYSNDIIQDSFHFVSVEQINKFLQQNDLHSYEYELQIRKTIHRIRMAALHKNDFDIIVSEPWKGYRINSSIFMGKN